MRVQKDGPALQVDSVDIEEGPVSKVERDQHLFRVVSAEKDLFRLDPLKGGQVTDRAVLEVYGVDVVILVAVEILKVEDFLAVHRPAVEFDSPVGVVADLPIVALADGANPDVEDSLLRWGQIGEARPVGRDLWGRPNRVAEEKLPGNQSGFLGGSRKKGYG